MISGISGALGCDPDLAEFGGCLVDYRSVLYVNTSLPLNTPINTRVCGDDFSHCGTPDDCRRRPFPLAEAQLNELGTFMHNAGPSFGLPKSDESEQFRALP